MIGSSFRLFRIWGVEVGIHPSWLIIFGLITWSLAVGFLPNALPGLSDTEAWVIGAITAILMFGSVLLHELAHSYVAIRRGLPVHSITLFLFGGVSNLTGESKDPRTEFLIAIVGPLASFVIGGVSFLIAMVPMDDRITVVFAYLALINVLLGGFNLIPGYPLDGGRVVRSIVWQATGSVRRATEIAGGLGQFVGYGFIVWGVFEFFNGNLLGGLWIGAIGWFLQNAASGSVSQLMFEQRLAGLRVRDALTTDVAIVPPGLSVADLIEEYLLREMRRAILVADNGRLVGIVTLGDIQKVPVTARQQATVAHVMTGPEGLVTIAPDATLREAAEALSSHDFDQLPVVEEGRPLGLITRADVIREFQVREALNLPTKDGPRPDGGTGSSIGPLGGPGETDR